MEQALAVLLGFLVGLIAAMLGIGGGVLLVSILHIILGLNIHEAVGTSLFIIIFLSTAAAISYFKQGLVRWKLALIFEVGSTPGAILGALTSDILPSQWLKTIFSILLFYVAYRMWRRKKNQKTSNNTSKNPENLDISRIPTIIGLGVIAGFLSGLLGIGGGIVKVPVMNLILALPIHNAVATSTFMISITTLTGSISHLLLKNIQIQSGLLIAPSAIVGSIIGTRISTKIRGKTLSKIFAVCLILMAVRMLITY